jgi:hypothetical protein
MLRKTMLSIFFVVIAIGYGQSNAGSFKTGDHGRFVPKLMNYQGYLTDTLGIPIDDTLDMTFSIYDGVTSGNLWWSETQTNIPIVHGIFSVILGTSTSIPDSVFVDGTDRWLELVLEGPVTLAPRTRMTSAGYAYMATYSDTAEYARNSTVDNDWVRGTPDSVLYTSNFLGIARGSVDNMLYGAWVCSHINFGLACTTGTSGSDNFGCTVTGGLYNSATESFAFIGAGRDNEASGWASAICGGDSNVVIGQNSAITGGHNNTVSGDFSVIAGGQQNQVSQPNATIGGGYSNTVADDYATISGGHNNYVRGIAANIGGGSDHQIGGNYSCIPGGYADTIDLGADYSCLFGIGSKLTKDSTFMVDMPHIHFGSQMSGYEFPIADGSVDQVLKSNGGGALSWTDGSDFSYWIVTDSVLYTKNFWGLARGGAGNILYSTDSIHTHVNLGRICTTGTSGSSFHSITIGGGSHNCADSNWSTVAGGLANKVIGAYSCIGGGAYNEIYSRHGTICAGYENTVRSIHGGVFSGYYCDAGNDAVLDTGIVVTGGVHNDAFANYAFIGGGRYNYVDGKYSAIIGGYADTIAAGADYSYLFGIGGVLRADSTFMVDMPHIRFGDEATGYEFPDQDGSADQVLITDGSGQLSWVNSGDNDWVRSTPDSVLFTANYVSIARGGAGNLLYGASLHTHINFGVSCTTGSSGYNWRYTTICGGVGHHTADNYSFIGGGLNNSVFGMYGVVAGGNNNNANNDGGAVCGGEDNLAMGLYSFVGGGKADTTWSPYNGVLSGYSNRAGTYTSDSGCVVAGGWDNFADAKFSFVGGGQDNSALDDWAVVCGGGGNTVDARLAVVCGGANNQVNDDYSSVVGGAGNIIDGSESFIGGGQAHYISGDRAVIGGGYQDSVEAIYGAVLSGYRCQAGIISGDTAAVVCGGWENQARADYSFTGGGEGNIASAVHSTCVGGYANTAFSSYSAVIGGRQNYSQGSFSCVAGGYNNRTLDDRAFVGCGSGNQATGFSSVIAGGENNRATGDYAVVAGGIYDSTEAFAGGILTGWYNNAGNDMSDSFAVVVGGYNNSALARYAFIGNGNGNSATGNHCIVVGGLNNTASVLRTFVGGGYNNTASADGAAICGGLDNSANGWFAFVGAGYADTVMAYWGNIGGGYSNLAGNAVGDSAATIAGGWNNTINAKYSFIGGGKDNEINYTYSAICGGSANTINNDYSFIGAGFGNTTNGDRAFIGGGYNNTTGTDYHTFIGNGYENYNYGYCSAIPCGYRDSLTANADYSMAFGNYVYVDDDHFVILYDGSNSGCLWINADHHDISPGNWPIVVGTSTSNGNTAYLSPAGVWTDGTFDRNKYDVQPITRATVLNKLKQIPILRHKITDGTEQHIIPDVEKFYNEFGCGTGKVTFDKKHVSATDMAGVSLAAIQELTFMIEKLQEENTALKKRLEILENKTSF